MRERKIEGKGLEATESWAGPGNEAITVVLLCKLCGIHSTYALMSHSFCVSHSHTRPYILTHTALFHPTFFDCVYPGEDYGTK